MYDHALEFVVVVVIWVLFLIGFIRDKLIAFLSLSCFNALLRKRFHVKLIGELIPIIDLQTLHGVKVKLKSSKHDYKSIRELFDALTAKCRNLALTYITLIRIVLLQELAFYEGFKTFSHCLFVFNL